MRLSIMLLLAYLAGISSLWAAQSLGPSLFNIAAMRLGYIKYVGIPIDSPPPEMTPLPSSHDYAPLYNYKPPGD